MRYDAFISYTRLDRAWAEKLRQDLINRGFEPARIFFDQTRINAGDLWDNTLQSSLDESRNLILLWSDNAAQSDWVKTEAAVFKTLIYKDDQAGAAHNRKLLQLNLQGRFEQYAAWQGIDDLRNNKSYDFAKGPEGVDSGLWQGVLDKLATALNFVETAPSVWQVVLAATRDEMSQVNLDDRPDGAESLNDLLPQLGLTHAQLLDHYGANRSDWRPFDGEKNILALLAELRTDVLERGGPVFRWQPIGQAFWTDPNIYSSRMATIVNALRTQPSVIVIDAFSLYASKVLTRYKRIMAQCLQNEVAGIMVLPPFGLQQRERLRQTLSTLIIDLNLQFYNLDFAGSSIPKAFCSVLTPDNFEMHRLLSSTVYLSRDKHWSTKTAGPVK